jgi:hypothetical protein
MAGKRLGLWASFAAAAAVATRLARWALAQAPTRGAGDRRSGFDRRLGGDRRRRDAKPVAARILAAGDRRTGDDRRSGRDRRAA